MKDKKKTILKAILFVFISQLLTYISIILHVKRVVSYDFCFFIFFFIFFATIIAYFILFSNIERIYAFMVTIVISDIILIAIEYALSENVIFKHLGNDFLFLYLQQLLFITLILLLIYSLIWRWYVRIRK